MAQRGSTSLDHIKCEFIDPSEVEQVIEFAFADFLKVSDGLLNCDNLD